MFSPARSRKVIVFFGAVCSILVVWGLVWATSGSWTETVQSLPAQDPRRNQLVTNEDLTLALGPLVRHNEELSNQLVACVAGRAEPRPKPVAPAPVPVSEPMPKTKTLPTFMDAFIPTNTRPKFLTCNFGDIGRQVADTLSFSPCETLLFQYVLDSKCLQDDNERQLVVDVGGNVGYFAMYAAKLGCRVLTFEPTLIPSACINSSIIINQVQNLVQSFPVALGSENSVALMNVNLQDAGHSQITEGGTTPVPVRRLPDFLAPKEKIFLLKIDIEGYEGHVFDSIDSLITEGRVEHIIVEVKTKIDMGRKAKFLNKLLDHGYKIYMYLEHYGSSLDSFDFSIEKCIPTVKQFKSKLPEDETAKRLFIKTTCDVFITKGPIPAGWQVDAAN